MTFYIINLFIMLPLMGLLIYGCLWLYRKYQPQMMVGQNSNVLNVVETLPLGVQSKLAVVDFGGRKILLAVTRNGIQKIDTHHAE
jgi:flagellar protein FliO/FliZ